MELGGGGGGGESEANRTRLTSDDAASKDHLSALPDDPLIAILIRLSTREAVRTSVLSRRWRRIWALLPGLSFDYNTNSHQIMSTLQAHDAALRRLLVFSQDATADSVAAWLAVAAPRLSGHLYLNLQQERISHEGDEEITREDDDYDEEEDQEDDDDEEEGDAKEEEEEDDDVEADEEDEDDEDENEEAATQRGTFELPCLRFATSVVLRLGFLGIAMPPAGVFTRFRELCLYYVRIHGPRLLGDAVSKPQCPCLQRLTIHEARGLDNLAIHSNALQNVELTLVRDMRQLTIVAPALEDLIVTLCFYYSQSQPVASITAPQLGTLIWSDLYDPSYVHLGKMKHLRLLKPCLFTVYGNNSGVLNPSCLSLLRCFKVIEHLILKFFYLQNLDNYQYMMEDMTMLPDIMILQLNVVANGHCFGSSAFHVLRMCSGIRRLMLRLEEPEDQTTCPPGCICIQQQNWESEHLLLNRLKEVEINQFRGSKYEFAFVKQLFVWATTLQKMIVIFDNSVSESVAKEMSQVLRSFSRPEIALIFGYIRIRYVEVMYAPED